MRWGRRGLHVKRLRIGWLASVIVLAAAGAAEARTHVAVDVALRDQRPRITRFRRLRRFGWHSGFHYGPYADDRGRHRVGWHRGTHRHWYTVDVPVLDRIDRADWEVFVRLGEGFRVRVRGDADRRVRRSTVVRVPRGRVPRWVTPDGNVIVTGRGSGKLIVADGWRGVDLGDSIIVVELPDAPGVEVYLKRRTKELAHEAAEKAAGESPGDAKRRRRDELLDRADAQFVLGLYPGAALLYQKAMKLDDTDAVARFAVAHALFALGSYRVAGENVRVGLDRYPEWGLVDLELPKFYKRRETFEEKLGELEAAVRSRPDDADVRLLLGYCYYFSGRRDAALREFERLAAAPGGDKHAEMFLIVSEYEPAPDDGGAKAGE